MNDDNYDEKTLEAVRNSRKSIKQKTDEAGEEIVIKETENFRYWDKTISIAKFNGVLFVDTEHDNNWTIVVLDVANSVSGQGWNCQVKFNMQKNPDKLNADQIIESKLIVDLLIAEFKTQYDKVGDIIVKMMKAIDAEKIKAFSPG